TDGHVPTEAANELSLDLALNFLDGVGEGIGGTTTGVQHVSADLGHRLLQTFLGNLDVILGGRGVGDDLVPQPDLGLGLDQPVQAGRAVLVTDRGQLDLVFSFHVRLDGFDHLEVGVAEHAVVSAGQLVTGLPDAIDHGGIRHHGPPWIVEGTASSAPVVHPRWTLPRERFGGRCVANTLIIGRNGGEVSSYIRYGPD